MRGSWKSSHLLPGLVSEQFMVCQHSQTVAVGFQTSMEVDINFRLGKDCVTGKPSLRRPSHTSPSSHSDYLNNWGLSPLE